MERRIKPHQQALFEMLCDLDRVCKENQITYMLFGGSLLGAVRHKGFIPWDDDVDVIFSREDYEKFLRIAQQQLPKDKYFVQAEFSEHWPMFFSKLRKNNTAFIERYIAKDQETHMGIYIDLFPYDRLSSNKVVQFLQFAASKIVIAKSLDTRGYLTDSTLKKIMLVLCRHIPTKALNRFVQHRGPHTGMVHTFFAASSKFSKNVFPETWFTETTNLEFEGGHFPCTAHSHELLTKLYGDYMTEPPPEQRGCKVHGEIIDLEHSYEEYKGVQETMEFEEYTRSIR